MGRELTCSVHSHSGRQVTPNTWVSKGLETFLGPGQFLHHEGKPLLRFRDLVLRSQVCPVYHQEVTSQIFGFCSGPRVKSFALPTCYWLTIQPAIEDGQKSWKMELEGGVGQWVGKDQDFTNCF